jgi:hypothetical protein
LLIETLTGSEVDQVMLVSLAAVIATELHPAGVMANPSKCCTLEGAVWPVLALCGETLMPVMEQLRVPVPPQPTATETISNNSPQIMP